jgi:transcriptional regulator with XRE-family HTH domain
MRRIWLTEKRLSKGLNQHELAELCDISNRTISNLELGKRDPSGTLALKIAEVLEFDMALFFQKESA